MKKLILITVVLATMIACLSCSGSSAPAAGPGNGQGNQLPELEFDLTTDPGSSVDATAVDGQMVSTDDALNARQASSLPTGFNALQGMYFTPETLPGAGFSGVLSVMISMGDPSPNQYDGVRLFLFLIHPETMEAIPIDSSRAFSNWVNFDIDALGYMVIAENTSIPRPGTVFTVSGFADLAATGVGSTVSFWALASNGTDPYTFAWDFGDGNTGTGDQTSHIFTQAGEYSVQVTATDASGASVPASSTPLLISANPVPLGNVNVDVLPDVDIERGFIFSATTTGGNPPLSYAWDFDGDGTTDSTEAPPVTHQYSEYGLYGGTLTVQDLIGDQVQDTFIIDARELTLESDTTFGQAHYEATFNLTALGLGTGAEVTVTFGDGEELADAGSEFSHIFATTGVYSVQASVTETVHETDVELISNLIEVVVTDGPNPQISAMAPNEGPVGTSVTVVGFNFGENQEDGVVLLGTLEQQITLWSDSLIEFEIVSGSLDGEVTILRDDKVSNPKDFNVLPQSPGGPGGGQI